MNVLSDDAIVAVATAAGRGAVGVVRVSGANLSALARAITGRCDALKPRFAHYGAFFDGNNQAIDFGLSIYFPAPHSYTGEDVLELQAHGGSVVLQLLVNRLLELGRDLNLPMRLAAAGEFTERAFLNGKLDLAQAEAVMDLIEASTESAAKSASRSLAGDFSSYISQLGELLTNWRLEIEAQIDFPEEELENSQFLALLGQGHALRDKLSEITKSARHGQLLRDGLNVVIAGQPNVGKSSLLNALAMAELAIVTPIAGTTRDVLSQSIQIEGVPIHVFDTAGLRDSDDEVEKIGMQRAWQQLEKADAVLFLHDVSKRFDKAVISIDADISEKMMAKLPKNVPVCHVWNKCDLADFSDFGEDDIPISAKTGTGIDLIRKKLLDIAGWQNAGGAQNIFMARQRHLTALEIVDFHIENVLGFLQQVSDSQEFQPWDLMAEELRLAQVALGEIIGQSSADDLLGLIFSRFCIGK